MSPAPTGDDKLLPWGSCEFGGSGCGVGTPQCGLLEGHPLGVWKRCPSWPTGLSRSLVSMCDAPTAVLTLIKAWLAPLWLLGVSQVAPSSRCAEGVNAERAGEGARSAHSARAASTAAPRSRPVPTSRTWGFPQVWLAPGRAWPPVTPGGRHAAEPRHQTRGRTLEGVFHSSHTRRELGPG